MSSHRRAAPTRPVCWLIALALALYSGGYFLQLFKANVGLDFYHYWGIAKARDLASESLASPYVDGPRYAAVLNAHADGSRDAHLQRANAQRRAIDPTGTPLFYLSFDPLPLDYSDAHALFRAIQLAAFWLALAWLARMAGADWALGSLFATATSACWFPFISDMSVGNVNALQLLACAGLVSLAARLVVAPSFARAATLASALVAFTLYKPNLGVLVAAFGAVLALVVGARSALKAVGVATIVGVVLVALSALWIGGWQSWLEWLAFLSGPRGGKIAAYSVGEGNYALSIVGADAVGAFQEPLRSRVAYGTSLAIVGLLAATWIAAVRRGGAKWGELAREPLAIASAAIVITLAASPLVWFHYGVLALLPAAWLLFDRRSSSFARLCAAVAYLGYGMLVAPYLNTQQWRPESYAPWIVALAWLPLWAGILSRIARRGASSIAVVGVP